MRVISILEVERLKLTATRGSVISNELIIQSTRRWLQKAVIGLGLCPFAEGAYRANRVRLHVSEQRTAAGLLEELRSELTRLNETDASICETTLLIHPWVLNDFIEFNDFLQICDETVADLGLEGEIQVASFHPHYQFADTEAADVENHTNHSPYPTLHLLREASIDAALAGIAEPESIYQKNIARLRELGEDGWQALWLDQDA